VSYIQKGSFACCQKQNLLPVVALLLTDLSPTNRSLLYLRIRRLKRRSSEVGFVVLDSPLWETYQSTTAKEKSTLRLRYNYTNLERLSSLAKQIESIQNDCSIRRQAHYKLTNGAGMGSELHTYCMVLCVVMEMQNVRLRTVAEWIYNDREKCNDVVHNAPMMCYFPQAEPICPDTMGNDIAVETFDIRYNSMTRKSCPHTTRQAGGYSNVRAATTEYLFTRVSNIIQEEGERQLNIVFNKSNSHYNTATFSPTYNIRNNLITVHIRWGDKQWEMKLVSIDTYIEAIYKILDRRQEMKRMRNSDTPNDKNSYDEHEVVHIYLATEDPNAYNEFMKKKPPHWQVYVDQYYIEMLPFRTEYGQSNVHVNAAKDSRYQGRNGLIALGSLLVAMEANDFVLTTASNWSRLINELRMNILDPRCNNCTFMIDLLYDEL
jgi:hypothetical protein